MVPSFRRPNYKTKNPKNQYCGSGMFIPDHGSDFFPFRIPDPNFFHPGSRIRIKEFKYLNHKMVSKLSEIWSGFYIPDPDPESGSCFLPIPDPVVKKAPDPGSATLEKSRWAEKSSTVVRMRKPDWIFFTPMKKSIFFSRVVDTGQFTELVGHPHVETRIGGIWGGGGPWLQGLSPSSPPRRKKEKPSFYLPNLFTGTGRHTEWNGQCIQYHTQ
jgi:hypothetical protein